MSERQRQGVLKVASGLGLPLEAVTETIAILGIRGSGKTNTAVVITEELLEHGQPVAVIDPTDVWWGLKSSKDGERAGYPVVVLGGRHGDLPLTAADGATVADFVVDEGASVILSLRHFESQADQRRFVTEFARRLYFRKGQEGKDTPLMVLIDEASLFVPQRVGAAEAPMVGAIQKLVRQGRSSGLGVTLIDQRASTVNKDVLTQLELLICHRTSSPQDRKALEAWVEQHDAHDHRDQFLKTLAGLPQGTAWFWSPGWLDLFQQVAVRARRTFDSSRTPKAGEQRVEPRKLAAVDLDALKAKMAATLERARADDPVELRRQLAERDRKLRELERRPATTPEPKVETVEIPAISADHLHRLEESVDRFVAASNAVQQTWADVRSAVEEARALATRRTVPARVPAMPRPAAAPRRAAPVAASGSVAGGERKILTALAQYPDGRSKTQVAILTGYAHTGGGFNNYLSSLRSKEWIEGSGDRLLITDAGLGALGTYDPLPSGQELLDYWLRQLGKAERLILGALVGRYPRAASKEEIAAEVGYEASGGGFNNALSRLRSLELIGGRRELRASGDLFA